MKFKKCSEEKCLQLRKPSVKRMHRPERQDKIFNGRAVYAKLFSRIGVYIPH